MGVNLVALFRGQNRLLSLWLCFAFSLANGCQTLPKGGEGRGVGRGARALGTGRGSQGSLFCLHKKGRGVGRLVPLLPVCGLQGGLELSGLSNNVAETSPGAVCGAVHHSDAGSTSPSPGRFPASPGGLIFLDMRRQQVSPNLLPFEGLQSCC